MTTQHTDEMREAFEKWAQEKYHTMSFPLAVSRHSSGEYMNAEICRAYEIWQAAAEAKLAQAIYDREQAERQLAKIAAENMRLREVEGKYMPVIEKMAGALDMISSILQNTTGEVISIVTPRTHEQVEDALALAAPLLKGDK